MEICEQRTGARGLSGFAVKWIAIASMVIDHFGSIVMDGVLSPYRTDGMIYFTTDMPWFILHVPTVKAVCEVLGSIGFPLFCFLIAEGACHTRSMARYGARLGAFALLSEIPYDLAHYGEIFQPRLQNVMFTLCIGVFTIYAIERFAQRETLSSAARWALTAGVTVCGMGLAFAVRGEYVFLGVLTMVLFYLLRKAGWWRLAGIAPLLIVSPWVLLALPAMALYNGTRGRGSQYFFYVFYPAHFLLFAGIAYLLANR